MQCCRDVEAGRRGRRACSAFSICHLFALSLFVSLTAQVLNPSHFHGLIDCPCRTRVGSSEGPSASSASHFLFFSDSVCSDFFGLAWMRLDSFIHSAPPTQPSPASQPDRLAGSRRTLPAKPQPSLHSQNGQQLGPTDGLPLCSLFPLQTSFFLLSLHTITPSHCTFSTHSCYSPSSLLSLCVQSGTVSPSLQPASRWRSPYYASPAGRRLSDHAFPRALFLFISLPRVPPPAPTVVYPTCLINGWCDSVSSPFCPSFIASALSAKSIRVTHIAVTASHRAHI